MVEDRPGMIGQAVGKLRRLWLTSFRRGYVSEQLKRRRGSCNGCGRCCELVFRCRFLTGDRRCRIYGRGRPAACRFFPVDERDLTDVGGQCGYWFE
ncbi:MAG: hypothetical protein R6V05_03155, partial [Candidatus Brocadiia bacterium]